MPADPTEEALGRLTEIAAGETWEIHLCDHVQVSADIKRVCADFVALKAQRDEAVKLMTQYAREAGEATGRLETSEAAGIVEGWRERAEQAERERDALKAAKWDVKHVDTMNDMVTMGLARDAAIAERDELKARAERAEAGCDQFCKQLDGLHDVAEGFLKRAEEAETQLSAALARVVKLEKIVSRIAALTVDGDDYTKFSAKYPAFAELVSQSRAVLSKDES